MAERAKNHVYVDTATGTTIKTENEMLYMQNNKGKCLCLLSETKLDDKYGAPELMSDAELLFNLRIVYASTLKTNNLLSNSMPFIKNAFSGDTVALEKDLGVEEDYSQEKQDKSQAYTRINRFYGGKIHVINPDDPTAMEILGHVRSNRLSLEDKFRNGQTVLTICCGKAAGNDGRAGADIVQELLEEHCPASPGAKIDEVAGSDGFSSLHRAVQTQHIELVKVLVEKGGDIGLVSAAWCLAQSTAALNCGCCALLTDFNAATMDAPDCQVGRLHTLLLGPSLREGGKKKSRSQHERPATLRASAGFRLCEWDS